MLVFVCRLGEALEIGESVTIAVTDIRGSQVRIGIEAPREVKVLREEIYGEEDEPQSSSREQ